MKNEVSTSLSKSAAEGNQRPRRQPARYLVLFALAIAGLAFHATPSYASTPTVADLKGSWVVSLVGVTGCGNVAMRAAVSLGSTGKSNSVSLDSHSGCGNATTSETFTISVASDGHGDAHLSCGEGCGWDFEIQLEEGNNFFSLVDVTNGENYLAGTAVRKQ